MSKNFDKLSIHEISEKLGLSPERLEDIIQLIMNKQKSPIKKYVKYNNEVIFNR
jgi:hypothetical protein